MLASVIIPTNKNSDIVLYSLKTWQKQTLSSDLYEVIVVDNNTINKQPVFLDFINSCSNMRYLKENIPGATNARHSGARAAKSEILIFCDDDGLFNPECISEILKVYELNSEVSAVAGKIEIEWDKEPPEWIKPYEFMLAKLDYGNELLFRKDLFLNGGLFSIKKSVFEQLGGFNPDLIGDYLVGDGDSGLVNKLHEAGKLIGWTPFAVMKHLQFVDQHGTIKDMGRRFYNIGISDTYTFYRKHGFRINVPLLFYILKSIIFFVKKSLEYIFTGKTKSYFSMMQKKGELAFFLNMRHKIIRNEVSKKDCYSAYKI